MTDALGRPRGVLVLGGTSEIGLAIARALVARGASHVWLAGRDEAAMRAAVEPLGPAEVHTLPFDALDPASHGPAIAAAFDAGGIDVVVLAFAVLGDQRTYEADPAAGAAAAGTNFTAGVSAGLHAARALAAQGHGTLVVLSSVAASRPRRSNYVYGAAKAGLDFFARGLEEALRGTGARVLVVRPGFVRTRMTAGLRPLPFATTPEAVAADVVRALDGGASVAWSPPLVRWVALALRVMPAAVLHRLDRR
ncbi:MAG: SDR family NAD(P)-dependent oxidoreductase [Dehalococcoidia bacterium]|nr:SDR family NAD(P)-dependent oxidoreductase [Dehalococcoidia bacterium]